MKGFLELSTTLGVSLRIKGIVAALHVTWPLGAWWLGVFTTWPLGFPPFSSFWDWNPSLPHFFDHFCFWTFAFFLPVHLRHHFNFAPVAVLRIPSVCAAYFEGMFFFSSLCFFFFIICLKIPDLSFFLFPCLFCCCLFYGFLGFKPFPYLFL